MEAQPYAEEALDETSKAVAEIMADVFKAVLR
jgi:hypothetical protein